MEESDRFEAQLDALETSLGGATSVASVFNTELRQMGSTISETNREVRVLSSGINRGLRKAFDGLVFDGLKLSDALRNVAQSMVDAAYNAALRPVTSHLGSLLGTGIEGLIQGVTSLSQAATVPLSTQKGTLPEGSGPAAGMPKQSAPLPAVPQGHAVPAANGGAFARPNAVAFANGGAFDRTNASLASEEFLFARDRVAPFARGEALGGIAMRGANRLTGGRRAEADLPLMHSLGGRPGARIENGSARPVQVVMNITTPDADGFRRSQSQIAAQMSRALSRGQRNR